jgi:hypothetical protein
LAVPDTSKYDFDPEKEGEKVNHPRILKIKQNNTSRGWVNNMCFVGVAGEDYSP